jgi:hypothetical protein
MCSVSDCMPSISLHGAIREFLRNSRENRFSCSLVKRASFMRVSVNFLYTEHRSFLSYVVGVSRPNAPRQQRAQQGVATCLSSLEFGFS